MSSLLIIGIKHRERESGGINERDRVERGRNGGIEREMREKDNIKQIQ